MSDNDWGFGYDEKGNPTINNYGGYDPFAEAEADHRGDVYPSMKEEIRRINTSMEGQFVIPIELPGAVENGLEGCLKIFMPCLFIVFYLVVNLACRTNG